MVAKLQDIGIDIGQSDLVAYGRSCSGKSDDGISVTGWAFADRIVIEAIVTQAAVQGVLAERTVQQVVAIAAKQRVIAKATVKRIVAPQACGYKGVGSLS